MSKKTLVAVEASSPKFRGCIAPGRWTLCLGAGISRGITPTWFDLARSIVNETFGSRYTPDEFAKLVADSGWSLDAWIQAAANEYAVREKPAIDFQHLIESVLYGKLRKDVEGTALAKYLIKVLNNPIQAPKNRVLEVCEFFEGNYNNCSLLGLARFLISAAQSGRKPYAVITFNADTLLETLIYLFLRRDHYLGPGPHGHPLYHYKSVNRPSLIPHHQYKEKTNVFHCHGTIMPDGLAIRRPRDARNRLVFLESEYQRVASITASWPETLFLFHAQTTRMTFVGLSMSDANIRRWMSASEQELALDEEWVFSGKRLNPEHFWITKKPIEASLQRLTLVSMLHLGIRPAWIDEWSDVESALMNMLAL